MALKLPFVLYGFHLFKDYRKWIIAILIFTGALAIFLVNARAAILSVGLLFAGYLLLSSLNYLKNRAKQHLRQLAIVSGIFFFSLAISQWMLRTGLEEVEGSNGRTSYGTVLSRMSAIEFNNQSSNNRFRLWKDALDYTRKHWLLGAGTGNWKLESIRYTSLEDNDLYVPYHAHNDFLETAAETGIPGMIFYIALYIVCGWKLLLLIRKSSDDAVRYLSLALFFSLMAYGVDAFFNFPSERPVMQLLFWMILAFTLVLSSRENGITLLSKKSFHLFPIILLLLSFSLVHYSYGYYSSMKLQAKMLSEYDTEPVYPTDEIEEGWKKAGAFPNISAQYTLPLASMVARYHIRDGNYETALQLIEEATNNNPYIYFNEFLKGFIYLKKGRYDSAFVYTSSSFHNRPRCKPYFKNHMTTALMVRDSLELEKTFHRYLQFRNEPYAWELYLGALYEWRGASGQDLLQQMIRARKEFPDDEGLKKLENLMKGRSSLQPLNEDSAKTQKAIQLRQSAEDNFARQRYALAARQFTEAFGLNAADLSLLENSGLCLYASGEYSKALQSFESVMVKGGLAGGKSEFYKALSLIALQRKSEACTWLAKALERGYDPAQVSSYQQKHCK
jgi:Tfp pilus assembly protein PilF